MVVLSHEEELCAESRGNIPDAIFKDRTQQNGYVPLGDPKLNKSNPSRYVGLKLLPHAWQHLLDPKVAGQVLGTRTRLEIQKIQKDNKARP